MTQPIVPDSEFHPQLPLGIKIREDYSLDNYLPDGNEAVVAGLQSQLSQSGAPFIYLWGKSGSGLSHLLQGACQQASARGATSIYLPMSQLLDLDLEMLQGVETLNLICIDDLHLIAGNSEWQNALFHLFNRLNQSGAALLTAAHTIPQDCGLELEDLVSRLASGVIYQVQELSDSGKIRLLEQRARQSGLTLSVEASQYILNRADRGVASLLEVFGRLDRASLSSGRKLTVPFIKKIMDW